MIKMKRFTSLLLAAVMVMSMISPAVAAGTYLDQLKVTDGVVTLDGTNPGEVTVALVGTGEMMVYGIAGDWDLKDQNGGTYLTLSGMGSEILTFSGMNYVEVTNGHVEWTDDSFEKPAVLSDGTKLLTATYTVAADTPAGNYTVRFNATTLTADDFEPDERGQYYTATITVQKDTPKVELTAADFTVTGTTKTYDGTTAVPADFKVSVKDDDTAVVTYDAEAAAYTDANAGEHKINVKVTGVEGNYEVPADLVLTVDGKIDPAAVTGDHLQGSAEQNIVAGVGSFVEPSFKVGEETVEGTLKYTYGSIEEGTYEYVVKELKDLPKGSEAEVNYTFTPTNPNFTGTVTGSLTLTVVDVEFNIGEGAVTVKTDATYGDTWSRIVTVDGNKISATLNGQPVEGTYSVQYGEDADGETVPNAGTQTYTVIFTDNSGKVYTVTTGTVEIAKAKLSLAGVNDRKTVYDGTKNGGVTEVAFTGLVNGETLKVNEDYTFTSEYSTENAGYADLTVVVDLKNNNYTLINDTQTILNLTVDRKPVTVSGITATDRTYDGTKVVDLDAANAQIDGLVAGDAVTVDVDNATGTMDDANAGQNKTVNIEGNVTLTGEKAKNYNLTGFNDVTVDIEKAKLRIGEAQAEDKVYDGTDIAAVKVTLNGTVNGETLTQDEDYTVTGEFAAVDVSLVGEAEYLVSFGVTLKENDKTNNYELEYAYSSTYAKILPALITATVADIADQEYTGREIKPTPVVTFEGKVNENDEVLYSVSYENNVEVGTATVKVTSNGGNYTFTEVTKDFNIVAKKGEVKITNGNALNVTYGTALPEVEYTKNNSNGVVTVTYYSDEACQTEISKPTDVGTYWVKAAMAADQSFGAAEDVVSFTISKAPATVTAAPTANTLTYNGEAQALVAAGTSGGGTMVYSLTKDGEYTTTVPTATDAKTYTVWYKVVGDANHSDSEPASVEVTIAAKNISGVTVESIADQPYTGEALKPALTVKDSDKVLFEDTDYTVVYSENTYVGTASVTIAGKGNYEGNVTKTFNITTAAQEPVITPSATVTKGGNTVDLKPLVTNAKGSVAFSINGEANGCTIGNGVLTSGENSGEVKIRVSISTVDANGDEVYEYDAYTKQEAITVTVVDKTKGDLTVTQNGITYGDELAAPTFEPIDSVISTVINYTGTTDAGAAYNSTEKPTQAGNYTVTVKCETATEIYEGVANFVIEKLKVDAPEQQDAVTYNGEAQTYGVVGNAHYTVETVTKTDAGEYDVKIALVDTVNTTWADDTTADLTHKFIINRKVVEIPTAKTNLVYNGTEQVGVVVPEGAVYAVSGDVKATNAGDYTAVVTLKDEANYEWASEFNGNIDWSIAKANLAIAADDQQAMVGDKELPAMTYTVHGLVNGETLKTEPTLAYESEPDLNKAGEIRITVSGAEAPNANYNAIEYVYGTLTIIEEDTWTEPSYSVKVDKPENGKIKLSTSAAVEGQTVTVTVTPDEGYELVELIVTDRKGNELKLKDKGDNKFSFKMPDGKVEIEAIFEKIEDQDEVENPFVDVDEDAYYFEPVLWALENGITNGMSADEFMPGVVCNRAQVVTFLWRAAGSPAPKSNMMPFADVPAGSYYYDAVLWAVENGITNGMSATEFMPNATVTRGQTVTFLWRAAGAEAVEGENSFVDVETGAYYYDAVLWAVENGITNGMSETSFAPANGCTRGQIVTFLYRAFAE